MVKRLILLFLGVVVVSYSLWHYVLDPKIQVQKVADQFWTAVTEGKQAEVAALLAPDATRSAAEWIAANQGLTFTPRAALVKTPALPCGVEWVANVVVRTPSHEALSRSATLKRVDGAWRIFTPEGRVC